LVFAVLIVERILAGSLKRDADGEEELAED
jgi:hypothetical protein